MSLGVLIAYGLAMILTPAFFSVMKSLDAPSYSGMLQDWLNLRLQRIEKSIFRRHRFYVALGAVVAIFLFAGAPMIHSDVQVARMLSGSTREIKDLKFAEQNLTPVNTLELMLEANPGAFKKAEIWKKVAELEKRLRDIPEVASTDSLLPLLEYLDGLMGSGAEPQKDIFAKPDVIPQLLTVTSLTSEGKRAIRRFVDEGYGRLRISVRIKDSPGVPISNTIEQIQRTADAVMNGWARPTVTGDLTVFASQQSALIKDQIESMAIAAVLITLIMMLQMGSPMLGLISLIPNVPPVAAVFGVMGWFGISLDGVTVFAATVAVGLAVDNTIHYLTQLKRDMTLNQGTTIEECVRRAYRLTAKQIASWSSVTLMGFLALAVSPFKPVVLFGILGCSALCLGLFGDLIFIQSLILSSPAIRSTIDKLIAKEIRAQTIPADYRHDEA
jgi:predicted RND superfamily exporter protein